MTEHKAANTKQQINRAEDQTERSRAPGAILRTPNTGQSHQRDVDLLCAHAKVRAEQIVRKNPDNPDNQKNQAEKLHTVFAIFLILLWNG